MAVRGVKLRYEILEFTFQEVDYPRIEDWLLLCEHLDHRAKKDSEFKGVEKLRDFLMELDFQSDEEYVPSKNKKKISALYSMESFNETKRAALNDTLYYLSSLLEDRRLTEPEKKASAALYNFLENSLYTKAMDAFVEVDTQNQPIEYEEGEEYTKIRKKTEQEIEEEKVAEQAFIYNEEIAF